uniref:Uncharacterized protein n=1 Tax=Anguilla anguilla TaxID=7936 RepID=A0A0E9PUI1_ANGAN
MSFCKPISKHITVTLTLCLHIFGYKSFHDCFNTFF